MKIKYLIITRGKKAKDFFVFPMTHRGLITEGAQVSARLVKAILPFSPKVTIKQSTGGHWAFLFMVAAIVCHFNFSNSMLHAWRANDESIVNASCRTNVAPV